MAYIRHIPPAQAGGRLAHIYREIRAEVPRVPNLVQVFSLRPETMEWIYRSWLGCMWNGALERTTKELLAVVVSRAARCDYCADAHMVFLQAAGMDAARAYEVERTLGDCEALAPEVRAALQFAAKLTADPRSINEEDRRSLQKHWPTRSDLAELMSVISSFNCIARVANALGVALEIPAALRRFEVGRRGAITLLARLTSISVDLREKNVPSETPETNQRALERLFVAQLGFPEPPPGFERLDDCPELFNGHLRLMEKAVVVVPRDRWMRIGLVVGRLTGCEYFAVNCAAWLAQRGVEAAEVIAASEGARTTMPELQRYCLRFARDLTLYSHKISEDRIHELRAVGLSDGAILDLAFVAGIFNGMTRFVVGVGEERTELSGRAVARELSEAGFQLKSNG